MIRIVRALVVICLIASSARAVTFTVDDAGTLPDATPGDGACLTASATCTLMAAIMESEASPGPDIVEWAGLEPAISSTHVIADDLTLRGTLGPRGSRGTELTVIAGGRLLAEGVSLSGVSLTADVGTIELQSVTLSASPHSPGLLVLAGGSLRADHLIVRNSLRYYLQVEGGQALLSDVTLAGPGVLPIYVRGGELVMSDSTLRESYAPFLHVTGGNVRLERCTISGVADDERQGWSLIDAAGGTLELDGCDMEGGLGTVLSVGAAATVRISCTRMHDNRGWGIVSSGDVEVWDSLISNQETHFYFMPIPNLYLWSYGVGISVHGGSMRVMRTLIDNNDMGGGSTCTMAT